MPPPALLIKKGLLQACLSWFEVDFRQWVESPLSSQFPNYPLPSEVQAVIGCSQQLQQLFKNPPSDLLDIRFYLEGQLASAPNYPGFFKQMVLRYRRHIAARTEELRERTFHPGLIQTLDEEINSWDEVTRADWFQKIEPLRLPRSKDFLPVQYIEQTAFAQLEQAPRQYDEKFHILQAPALFLPDLA